MGGRRFSHRAMARPWPRRLARAPWAVFLVHGACLASLCLSFDNGSHPDEELYAAISTEMAWGGDWLIPHMEGEPVFFKPPLLYVLQAASLRALGESVFAARLPSLLASLATGWLVFRMRRRRGAGRAAALTTASLVLSSVGLLRFGSLGMMDPLFSLALLASVWALEPEGRWWHWSLAVATATLLKGPIGLWVLLLDWRRRWRALAGPALVLGVYALQASRQLHYGLPLVPLLLAQPRGGWRPAVRAVAVLLAGAALALLLGAALSSTAALRGLLALVGAGLGMVAWRLARRNLLQASLAFGVTWALVFGPRAP